MNERCLTPSTKGGSPTNQVLTNVHVWSHDGQWIYYDTRSSDSCFDGRQIQRVHSVSGEIQTVFESRNDACVGVVTASPTDDRITFIHGPENPTDDWQYAAHHRRGVIMTPGSAGTVANLDARDLVPPFTAGALRGGSHVHVFCPRGRSISFTYEDHVLAERWRTPSVSIPKQNQHLASTGNVAPTQHVEKNQRNVGIAIPIWAVVVPPSHPRNHHGTHFSFIATRTHDCPRPGSDEISRAYEDAWIAEPSHGDADSLSRSLAFIGDVTAPDGRIVPELFRLELPADCTVPDQGRSRDDRDPITDAGGPLQGTATTRPRPPAGTIQHRLTRTTANPYPGLACDVRHWPRSSPDGRWIAFLMRDAIGVVQLWLISPNGESMRALTSGPHGVTSCFTIRPDSRAIACALGDVICEIDIDTGIITPLTAPNDPSRLLATAVVYSPDGTRIAYARMVVDATRQRSRIHVVSAHR